MNLHCRLNFAGWFRTVYNSNCNSKYEMDMSHVVQMLVTDSKVPSLAAPANVSLASTPPAPPLEDEVLSLMCPGSNDDYGGQPMTRFRASLEALLWGLCEHKSGKI